MPQYAMSALNPTRQGRHDGARAARVAGRRLRHGAPGARAPARARRPLGRTCSTAIPIELSGGMKQRVVMVHLDAARPVAADRRRDHVGARRLEPARGRRAARRVPRPRLREEHDRDHPRPRRSSTRSPTRSSSCTPGKLAEKAPAETIVAAPRHPYTRLLHLVAPGGRCPLRRDAAGRASPAGRRRCSTRRPAAGSATAARSRSRSARRSRRSSRSSRATRSACWRAAA